MDAENNRWQNMVFKEFVSYSPFVLKKASAVIIELNEWNPIIVCNINLFLVDNGTMVDWWKFY